MLEKLLDKIETYSPNTNLKIIEKAYRFAELHHQGQYRKSGESYFIHPYEVAMILAEYNMDDATICAGLLHDVVEDTEVTYEDIVREFGEEVAILVDGVTKLKKIKFKSKTHNQGENLKKMVISMAKDVRVIIIKLADRLHNSRTLNHMTEEKQKEKALETLEIYAPIAHRLGMSKIKWELEDISLRYIDPKGYYDLVEKINKKRTEREEGINKIIDRMSYELEKNEFDFEISGRPKHFYSIYKKMYYQNKSFEQIYDLTAIRVLVKNIKDCYGVLGIVHTMWKPIPGRFKDYIAMPKPNMYQSLHTTVIGPKGDPFEIQIRTFDMHKVAEFGIAAHWKYKEGQENNSNENFETKLSWIRQLMESHHDLKDPEEFMQSLKIDFFNDEVFVFTPQGDVIDLPAGSTPVDFAYAVHTDVGNKCVGAKVDGRIAPLNYALKNGNIVEIITSKNSPGPSRDWLKTVKSSQAKSRIRNWFKKEEKDDNIIKGREFIEREVRREGFRQKDILKENWLKSICEKLKFSSLEDMYASVGYGTITSAQVTSKLKEYYKDEQNRNKKASDNTEVKKVNNNKKLEEGVVVKGIDNIKAKFCRCCSPVPGDDIVGYITKGRGVSVHRKDCYNIKDLQNKERFIEVDWVENKKNEYKAEIEIKAIDRPGVLSEITLILAEANLLVNSLNAKTDKNSGVKINVILEIKDVQQLKKIMKRMKSLEGVQEVYRVLA